jgi:hypothetical protein
MTTTSAILTSGTSKDVRFDSEGYPIAGTFTEVPAPVAAALLITGSGRIDRDSDARLHGVPLLRVGVTRQVAEALNAAHVVTLRHDKRGVGGSGGDYLRAGMTENLADARAGLHWLASHAPGLPLLTVGYSEGTCHASRLAAQENRPTTSTPSAAWSAARSRAMSWTTCRTCSAPIPRGRARSGTAVRSASR